MFELNVILHVSQERLGKRKHVVINISDKLYAVGNVEKDDSLRCVMTAYNNGVS